MSFSLSLDGGRRRRGLKDALELKSNSESMIFVSSGLHVATVLTKGADGVFMVGENWEYLGGI